MKVSTLISASCFAVVCVSSMLLGACASSSARSGSTASAAAGKPINAECAIMEGHPVPASNPATVTYKGQTIGFCCEDCVEAWNEMTEAEKDKAYKAILAAK